MGLQLGSSSTHFSLRWFSPQPHRDPRINDAAVRIMGRATLLQGVLDQAKSILSKT